MYYYGFGNSGNNWCQPNFSSCCNPCFNPCGGGGFGGGSGFGGSSWIAVILVIFLLLVLCGFCRGDRDRGCF